jgi:hypothetical protein
LPPPRTRLGRRSALLTREVPVPAGTITGLATTPLPRPAEVIEKLGL